MSQRVHQPIRSDLPVPPIIALANLSRRSCNDTKREATDEVRLLKIIHQSVITSAYLDSTYGFDGAPCAADSSADLGFWVISKELK
jgi:hypothetical protein